MLSNIRLIFRSSTLAQVLGFSILALFFIHYAWLLHLSFVSHQKTLDAPLLLEISSGLALLIVLFGLSRFFLSSEKTATPFSAESRWKNAQLIEALDKIDLIIVGLDTHGKITLANQKTCQCFGAKNSENLLGRDWFSLFVPEHELNRVKQAFYEVIDGNLAPFRYFESEIRLHNGDMRTFAWTTELIRNDYGEIIGLLSSGKDVTDERLSKKKLEQNSHLLNTLLNELPGPLLLQDTDDRILLANRSAAKFLNTTRDNVIGKHLDDLALDTGPDKLLRQGAKKALEKKRTQITYGNWLDPKTNRPRYFRSMKKNITTLDNDPLLLVMLHDITDLYSQTQALEAEQTRFTLAVEGSQDGIWDWDLTTDNVFYSPRYAEMLGYAPSTLTPDVSFWKNHLHPYDFVSAQKAVTDHLNGQTQRYEHRHRLRCADGTWKWVLARGKAQFNEKGLPVRMVGFQTDITEQMNHQKALAFTAKHDLLTELPNRFKLNDLLQPAMLECDAQNEKLALLYIDLDAFKSINDRYGYDAGDFTLKTIAERMKSVQGKGDLVSRIGGDEFALAITHLNNNNEILPILQQLHHELYKPIQTVDVNRNPIEFQITSSIGVSVYPQNDAISPDTLLRQADQAMLQAKTYGKNTYRFFNVDESMSLAEQHRQIRRIQKAIERDELVLHYQPKVQMDSSEVLGFEALVRWQRSEEGLVNPDHFLPFINHHRDIMLMLGEWVFDRVFQQLSEWNKLGHRYTVSINISTHELHKKSMHEYLKQLLTVFSDVSAEQIELEILETHALEDTETAFRIIQECQSLGIKVSLDDFGTGYSTLSYLKNLPVNTLKIDRTFVSDMLHDSASFSIMEAAMGLAQAFHCETIAEGVETVEQGIMLLKLGCNIAQGYVISKPLAAEQIQEWVDNWKGIEAWRNIDPIDAVYRELLYAENLHRNWMKSMEDYVHSPSNRSLPVLESQACFFGKWLQSKGESLLTSDQWQEINALHERMHSQAHQLQMAESTSDSLRLYDEMKQTQQRFLDCLSRIHSELAPPK